MNYKQIAKNIKNGIYMDIDIDLTDIMNAFTWKNINYDEFAVLINYIEPTYSQFINGLNNYIPERLEDIYEINCIKNYIEKVTKELWDKYKIKLCNHIYTFTPKEDGGIFTTQYEADADFGLISDLAIIDTIVDLRIDFRPTYYAYFAIHPIYVEKNENKPLLGDLNFIEIEIDLDGNLKDPLLSSY